MQAYDIALILTVEAETYTQALTIAKHVAEGVGQEGEDVCVVTQYETDNGGQRVLYLPSVEVPEC